MLNCEEIGISIDKSRLMNNWIRKKGYTISLPSITNMFNYDWYLKDVWIMIKSKTLVRKQKCMLYFYKENILYILNLHLTYFYSLSNLL